MIKDLTGWTEDDQSCSKNGKNGEYSVPGGKPVYMDAVVAMGFNGRFRRQMDPVV